MNPWRADPLDVCRRVLRLALWMCLMSIGLMTGVFLVVFWFNLCRFAWSWCSREWFGSSW